MTTTIGKNSGNFRPQFPAESDAQLDREVREAYAAMLGIPNTTTTRGIYDAAEGTQHPHRVLARRIREARIGKKPLECSLNVLAALERYARREYGRRV